MFAKAPRWHGGAIQEFRVIPDRIARFTPL
jgi:hypothetical protein